MLRWTFLLVIPLFIFTGCGDLEPEIQDKRTVILKMDFDQRSSSRTSSVSASELSQYNTHLILALPSWEYLTSSYKNFYSSFAQGLMNTADKKVSMEIPLNTQMKIFAFLFKENYSMSQLISGTREVGYYGESQPFSIGTNTNSLSIGISLIQVPGTGTDTDGGTDTGGGIDTTAPTVSFSPANGATGVAISDNIIITFSEAVRNIDNTVLTNSNIDSLITLKLTNANGANITFDATIDANMKVITINPISNLFYSQAVYVAIGATLEDSADNAITTNATFTTTMDPSLEAFYPFNGNANDESGNSYHGQLGNNSNSSTFPTLTTDRYGNADKAFSFDGNDWIALDKYVTVNSISEITVCAWIWSTDTTNNKFIISFDRSESYRLALNDDVNTNPYVGWDTTDNSSPRTTHDLGTPNSYGATAEDGNWHHICGWYFPVPISSPSSTIDKKIFIDGVMVASDNNSHSGRNLGTSDRTRHYGFIGWGSEASSFNGNGSNTHQDDFMIGKIDDVRIYSRSLSDEEISALYLREKP
jgi:hypothetical protein